MVWGLDSAHSKETLVLFLWLFRFVLIPPTTLDSAQFFTSLGILNGCQGPLLIPLGYLTGTSAVFPSILVNNIYSLDASHIPSVDDDRNSHFFYVSFWTAILSKIIWFFITFCLAPQTFTFLKFHSAVKYWKPIHMTLLND